MNETFFDVIAQYSVPILALQALAIIGGLYGFWLLLSGSIRRLKKRVAKADTAFEHMSEMRGSFLDEFPGVDEHNFEEKRDPRIEPYAFLSDISARAVMNSAKIKALEDLADLQSMAKPGGNDGFHMLIAIRAISKLADETEGIEKGRFARILKAEYAEMISEIMLQPDSSPDDVKSLKEDAQSILDSLATSAPELFQEQAEDEQPQTAQAAPSLVIRERKDDDEGKV